MSSYAKTTPERISSPLARGFFVVWIFLVLVLGCDASREAGETWSQTGRADGQLVTPRAIAYDPINDRYYVIDKTGRVQRYSSQGKFELGWMMSETDNGKPVGLSIGSEGNVWVADTHYQRVMIFSPDGKRLWEFGKEGKGVGQFIFPTDIAFDAQANVYVSEYGGNDRIQVFDPSGNHLRTFARFGQGEGELSRPQAIAIRGSELFVADACNHRVVVFGLDGKVLRTIGKVGSASGEFRFPYSVDFDLSGNLLVCEYGNSRLQTLTRDGSPVAILGSGGRRGGELSLPQPARKTVMASAETRPSEENFRVMSVTP